MGLQLGHFRLTVLLNSLRSSCFLLMELIMLVEIHGFCLLFLFVTLGLASLHALSSVSLNVVIKFVKSSFGSLLNEWLCSEISLTNLSTLELLKS